MYAPQLTIFLALHLSLQASAQDGGQSVWAVFGFNVHGDSTPVLLEQPRELTPLGARNLNSLGSYFRSRYVLGGSVIASPETWVQGLNQHKLDSEQVKIYTTSNQFTEGSAFAFMQGMYPPLGNTNQSYTYVDETYILSNGSIITAPLNDYQYPRVYASALMDPSSIYVAGQAACDKYQDLQEKYQSTEEFQQIETESAQFYSHLYNVAFKGLLDNSSVSYARATDIYEYLEYGYLHDRSLEEALSTDDLQRARVLANQYTFATNGNVTGTDNKNSDRVRAIAGRTLSHFILQSLLTNIETQGASSKMTLMFGGVEPIVAFASLSQLASSMNSGFYGMPALGSSLVVELFSMNSTSTAVEYPELSDMYVRLLFRNSSSTEEGFTQYPLFGYSPSQVALPFREFASELSKFSIPSTEAWCDTCNSSPMFCLGAANSNKKSSKNRLSLAAAGAIGAVVTLAVVAATVGIAWFCGVGMPRRRRSSALGGYRGSDKMASDQDISFGKTKNGILHQTDIAPERATARGHERVGSWEMRSKDRKSSDNMSGLDEEGDIVDINANTEPVRCHQIV